MSKPLVIYHADCPDGFCSAWVANRFFGGEADFLPAKYGDAPPEVSGRKVYILDFSYPMAVLEAVAASARLLVLLDHHKTAMADVSGFAPDRENVDIVFDMDKSGARLTWEYFYGMANPPWQVEFTEDRDLWRHKLPHTRELNAFLASVSRNFAVWDEMPDNFWHQRVQDCYVSQGQAILRYQSTLVESAVRHAFEVEIAGYRVLAVNTTVLQSEVAGRLAEGRPFGAVFSVGPGGRKSWSLRSREGGIDVSEVARRFGGGGHRNAAGYVEGP